MPAVCTHSQCRLALPSHTGTVPATGGGSHSTGQLRPRVASPHSASPCVALMQEPVQPQVWPEVWWLPVTINGPKEVPVERLLWTEILDGSPLPAWVQAPWNLVLSRWTGHQGPACHEGLTRGCLSCHSSFWTHRRARASPGTCCSHNTTCTKGLDGMPGPSVTQTSVKDKAGVCRFLSQ